MIRHLVLTPSKTYATEANVHKAVEKKFGPRMQFPMSDENLHYIVHRHTDGRYFPVFIGERALHAGIHHHFNVLA